MQAGTKQYTFVGITIVPLRTKWFLPEVGNPQLNTLFGGLSIKSEMYANIFFG